MVARLLQFFSQTFWCNFEVFQCTQAAQALCKRGETLTDASLAKAQVELVNLFSLLILLLYTNTTIHTLIQMFGTWMKN
jgi:hypothetical protein